MKKLTALVATAALAAAASPHVDLNDVSISQDATSRRVSVSYTLAEEEGIVTLDIQTNSTDGAWASIGGEHIVSLSGDVNKLVSTGPHTITWRPDKDWPGHTIDENGIRAVVKAWSKKSPPDYMAVSLRQKNTVRYFPSAGTVPEGVTGKQWKTDWMIFRKIPAANVEWRMGATATEGGTFPHEDLHYVTLTNDFYIGVYPLTQKQYQLISANWSGAAPDGLKPSYFANSDDWETRPLENVPTYANVKAGSTITALGIRGKSNVASWLTGGHAVESPLILQLLRNFTGAGEFDLPLDAQWEFACRAGEREPLYSGEELTLANVQKIAHVNSGETSPVGMYEPNNWGLYDMIGNVWETCIDMFAGTDVSPSTYDANTGATSTTLSNTYPCCRGGDYSMTAPVKARSAARGYTTGGASRQFGYRFVLNLP